MIDGMTGASTVLGLGALALVAVACAGAVLVVRHRRATHTRRRIDIAPRASRRTVREPRLLIGLTLVAGGLGWAIARGLHFYGLTSPDVAYDLDQPPLLLMLVGVWLLYRRRRR